MNKIRLKNIDTKAPPNADKKELKLDLKKLHKELFSLQHLFFASHSCSLLILFQGIDTSGKDGVIRQVFSCINPLGVHATAFGKPCDMELEHDYMWRIFQNLPPKGRIHIFNRSYYEDILVPTIQGSFSDDKIDKRYDFINAFENHLTECNTHVIKFFLHISHQEQKKRIKDRLNNPIKKWKYSSDDLKSSKLFDEYISVYENIINKCNKIPWIIIPSDDKWYRNFEVASAIVTKLKSLNLQFPNTPIIKSKK